MKCQSRRISRKSDYSALILLADATVPPAPPASPNFSWIPASGMKSNGLYPLQQNWNSLAGQQLNGYPAQGYGYPGYGYPGYGYPQWGIAPPSSQTASEASPVANSLNLSDAQEAAVSLLNQVPDSFGRAYSDMSRKTNVQLEIDVDELRAFQDYKSYLELGHAAGEVCMSILETYEGFNVAPSPKLEWLLFRDELAKNITPSQLAALKTVAQGKESRVDNLSDVIRWFEQHTHSGVNIPATGSTDDIEPSMVSSIGGASVSCESVVDSVSREAAKQLERKCNKDGFDSTFEEIMAPLDEARSVAQRLEQAVSVVKTMTDAQKKQALNPAAQMVLSTVGPALGGSGGFGGGGFGGGGFGGGGFGGGGFGGGGDGTSGRRGGGRGKLSSTDKLTLAWLKMSSDTGGSGRGKSGGGNLLSTLSSSEARKLDKWRDDEDQGLAKATAAIACANAIRKAMEAVSKDPRAKDANTDLITLIDKEIDPKVATQIFRKTPKST